MKKLILFLCLMALTIGAGQWEEITAITAIVLGIYFIISVIVYLVVELEFTVLPQHEDEIILLHYKGNRVETYTGLTFGKPLISVIKLPYTWLKEIKGGEIKLIETNLEIEMGDSTMISIPLIIEYKFLGPFKVIDFQKKLKITIPRKTKARKKIRTFSALNMFKPIVKTSYRQALKMDIIRFNNGQISIFDLAQVIKTQVDFPETFFSNLKKIGLEIGTPKLKLTFKK